MKRRRIPKRIQRLLLAALLAAIASLLVQASPNKPPHIISAPSGETFPVRIVHDGDTITVERFGKAEKIRLLGIDTPETSDPRKPVQCFGREASAYMKELLQGRAVRLESDPSQGEYDKYGRRLAYVWRDDGLFINQALIADGYAHEYTYQSVPYQYQAAFKAAQIEARDGERGLWSARSCNGNTTQAADQSGKK